MAQHFSFEFPSPDDAAGLRRLVLLLYALVLPPFVVLLFGVSSPELRLPAVAAVLVICGAAAVQVLAARTPTPRTWIFPAGIAPVASCGIAFAATHGEAIAFMAVSAAPLAWAGVLFTGPTVVAAWLTGVLSCLVVVTWQSGWMVGAGNAALFAIIGGLVGWVVYGQTLRRELTFLRALRLDINDIELVLHPEGRLLQVNDRAVDAYQYGRDELLTMTMFDIRKGDPVTARDQMTALMRDGAIVFRARHYRRDGTTFPVEVSARLVHTDGATVVHSLVRDITDRERVLAELTLQRERLLLATHAAGVGIWDLDLAERRLVWDDQMFRLYGVDAATFLGAEEDWSVHIHPDDRERTVAEIYRVLGSEDDYDAEFRIVRPDTGAVRHLRSTARVLRDPYRKALRIVGVNWDITDDKENAARLALLAQQADAANLAKSEFLANMSHEIRTPLHGVLGLMELLLDTPLDAEQQQFVEMAQSSGRQLRDLLDDILDLSKIESGRIALDAIDFDLGALMDDLARGLAATASQKGLTLSVSVDADVPHALHGDPKRLRQVLVNLVGNAVKFTERGSVQVRASLAGTDGDALLVRFAVRDTGIGIPTDKIGLLFDKFSQVSGSITRKYGGTGLGLAISREFVRLMDGDIGVESADGRGSEFWFTARLTAQAADQRSRVAPT